MSFHQLTYSKQLRRLRFLTTDILRAYGLEGSSIKVLKYQHHYVCRVVSTSGEPLLLRVSVSNWDNPAEFEAQLTWQEALWRNNLPVPEPIRTLQGHLVGKVNLDESTVASYALMRWVPGRRIGRGVGPSTMGKAGSVAALFHEYSQTSESPLESTLPRWDAGVVANSDHWMVGLGARSQKVLREASEQVVTALSDMDTGPEHFGVIHADLNLGNFRLNARCVSVIDFGDCGLGFYLYDLAVMLGALRRDIPSRADRLIQAYLSGYTRIRALPTKVDEQFTSFLMFRELIITKWLLTSENARARESALSWVPESVERLEGYLR